MKKTIMSLVVSALCLSLSAPVFSGPHNHHHNNHHRHYNHHHYHHHNSNRHWSPPAHHHWLLPAIIGGAVVYAATRPDPMPVQTAPVIVNPIVVNNLVTIDGVVYRREIIVINGIQQEVLIRVN